MAVCCWSVCYFCKSSIHTQCTPLGAMGTCKDCHSRRKQEVYLSCVDVPWKNGLSKWISKINDAAVQLIPPKKGALSTVMLLTMLPRLCHWGHQSPDLEGFSHGVSEVFVLREKLKTMVYLPPPDTAATSCKPYCLYMNLHIYSTSDVLNWGWGGMRSAWYFCTNVQKRMSIPWSWTISQSVPLFTTTMHHKYGPIKGTQYSVWNIFSRIIRIWHSIWSIFTRLRDRKSVV